MNKVLISNFKHKSERAQELAEFAIVLPLLLLIMFGVLDLGRAFHTAITVANIAREGARLGITWDWDESSGYGAIEAAARLEAQDSILDPLRLDLTADCGDCNTGDSLTVTATYDFNLLFGSFLPNFTIGRTAIMMIP